MVREADDIFHSFHLSNIQQKLNKSVTDKLKNKFVVQKKKCIFEISKFSIRKQEDGESVDTFITTLHFLAEHCNYRQ